LLLIIVLLFSAINFAGFIGRKAAAPGRGFVISGLLGGLISSTAVTLGFTRASRGKPESRTALAVGVVAACTILVPRVLVIATLLNPGVGLRLLYLLSPSAVIGIAVIILGWIQGKGLVDDHESVFGRSMLVDDKNPLRLWVAIKLAVVFQLAIVAMTWVRSSLSVHGVYGGAVLLGLTDVDALTVSMSAPGSLDEPLVAGHAIAAGIVANTVFKLTITVIGGSGKFRMVSTLALIAMAAATVTMLTLY
jgi:uncharacterized membrane protein (DUF4010 family)